MAEQNTEFTKKKSSLIEKEHRRAYLTARLENTLFIRPGNTMETLPKTIGTFSKSHSNVHGIFIEIMPNVPLRVAISAVQIQIEGKRTITFALQIDPSYIKRVIAHLQKGDGFILHGGLEPGIAIDLLLCLPGPDRTIIVDRPLAINKIAVAALVGALAHQNTIMNVNIPFELFDLISSFGDKEKEVQEEQQEQKSSPEKKTILKLLQAERKTNLRSIIHSAENNQSTVMNKSVQDSKKKPTANLPNTIPEPLKSQKIKQALASLSAKDGRILDELHKLKVLASYTKELGFVQESTPIFHHLKELSGLYYNVDDPKQKGNVKSEITRLQTELDDAYSWPKYHSPKQELLSLSRNALTQHLVHFKESPIFFFAKEQKDLSKQSEQAKNLVEQAKKLLEPSEDTGSATDSTVEYETTNGHQELP